MVECRLERLDEEARRLHYEALIRITKAWLLDSEVRLGEIRQELGIGTNRFDRILDRMEYCEDLRWIKCVRGSGGRFRTRCMPTLRGLDELARLGLLAQVHEILTPFDELGSASRGLGLLAQVLELPYPPELRARFNKLAQCIKQALTSGLVDSCTITASGLLLVMVNVSMGIALKAFLKALEDWATRREAPPSGAKSTGLVP